jgi:hypothetical protein
MQTETVSICWSKIITASQNCGDFIIRILGGADGVVQHLRAGMLLSSVKVAARSSEDRTPPSRYRVGYAASRRVLPRERFRPMTQKRIAITNVPSQRCLTIQNWLIDWNQAQ